MKKEIILIGGGGHCRSCIDIIEEENSFNILGIIDKKENIGKEVLDYKIIGSDNDLSIFSKKYRYAFITAGQIESPDLRKKLYKIAIKSGFIIPVIISPRAHVSKYSRIDNGTILCHDVLINCNVEIGENCIINNKVLLEHDVKIHSNTHISTGTVINGECEIGKNCFIGSNTVIKNGVNVCDNVIIGAGTVITSNISEEGIYFGNPCKKK